MRSGFLNASPSDSPTITLDKGSRNKRKFRTDQQQHPAAPLPAPVCASIGEGSKNAVFLGDTCSSAAMDPQSFHGVDSAAASPTTIGCCSTVQSFIPPDLISYPSSHACLVNASISPYGPQVPDFPTAFQHFPYPKDGQDYAELQQDSNWEAQLEAILMSMLDGVYKDALRRIVSFNFTQEEALSAVLRKGRWNKRDALTSIVESALAWLQNSEARSTTDLVFPDLKEMESFVLAEMVSMLRKVRPFLSKGDAMWCLLMCDLNVLLACTMDEDSVPLASKEGNTSNGVSSQTKQPTELPPSNVLPTNTITVVPPPQQVPCLPQANTQPTSILINSHKESRSAFSTPSFSSSPVGKVAVASRKGASSKLSVSISAQKPTASLTVEAVNAQKSDTCLNLNSMHEQAHQSSNPAKSFQLSVPQFPTSKEHAMKLGLHISNSNNGSDKCRNLKSDFLVQRDILLDPSPSYSPETQTAVLSVQCVPQQSDVLAKNYNVEQLKTFQPGATGSKLKANKTNCSTLVKLPDDNRPSVQTDLQIGSSNGLPSNHLPQDEAWTLSSSVCTAGSLASSGAELSLATASVISNASTEFSGDCPGDSCTDENQVSCSKAGVPVGQVLGCMDSSAEERKTVMLWQLVDRVKYLEAQLQDWTDWAQQKVMQAARRLTKDTAELKALRQERDEYMRLKKEKQALEESTMKKLAEMETSLGKALSQVERANSTAGRLESENAQVRKEMEAAKLTAAESVYVCQEATKREKKSIKKAQGWEKQKLKLQEELIEGKRNLFSLLEQLAQARERLQQAEVRWRQEKKAKEEAQLAVETEKRAKESTEHSSKKREGALQRKSEALSQRYREEVQKLESEITKIKLSMGLQPSTLSWGNSYRMASTNLDTCSAEKLKQINTRLLSEIADLRQSQKDVHRDRECMMCMSEEMSVVFLPCAHQVVCVKCNDVHRLMDCPSCRTPIQQCIRVYGVRP
ncbi:hypothetical protein L7F22_039754 [Adiantum nelumboides]|nr:hypothetical protein [Adiantum nelumboides]